MMAINKNVDIAKIHEILLKEFKTYNAPVVDLIKIQTNDPFKVLVATILSARTNDKTTVDACKKLFFKVNKIEDLNKLSNKEIEKLIYPVGFYHTKAEHLKLLPHALKEKFNNKIPKTVEELIELPGVGRKTANLVVAIAFDKPAVCVDTHVHRIMNIFGYVKTKTPLETEMALRKKLPIKYWTTINSILVAHGQHVCRPISPMCSKCKIEKFCNKIGVKKSR